MARWEYHCAPTYAAIEMRSIPGTPAETVCDWSFGTSHGPSRVNGHLMALAPELLDVCEAIAGITDVEDVLAARNLADDVIAKANQ